MGDIQTGELTVVGAAVVDTYRVNALVCLVHFVYYPNDVETVM